MANGRHAFGVGLLVISLFPVPAWPRVLLTPDCPDFHFPNSAFESIEQDHRPALLYISTGEKDDNHGVAFLVEPSPPYYLTARHVVASSIANPSRRIIGMNAKGRTIALQVIADDEKLDVALLKGVDSIQLNSVRPYELYFAGLESQDVTFSGLAFASKKQFTSAPPKENRFEYNEDATQLQLRVNTGPGDSGAPVYNRQGLVIGVVTNKKVVSQVTAVTMKSLSDFMVRPAISVPAGGAAWRLHDFVLNTSDRETLAERLTPGYSPEQVSNFQLLGAIALVIQNKELPNVNEELVYCPVIYAAHDRGLRSAAMKLENEAALYFAQQRLRNPPNTSPSAQSPDPRDRRGSLQASPPKDLTLADNKSDPQHWEAVADILFVRASEWSRKGDAEFYQRLSSNAEANYLEAIVSYLQQDARPLFVFERKENTNSKQAEGQAFLVLSRLGIDSSINLTYDNQTDVSSVYRDDRFASLLNKYYEAAVGAVGSHVFGSKSYALNGTASSDEPKKMAARNTAVTWATLLSESDTKKAKSWSLLADAMLKVGRLEGAARSLANVHAIEPADIDVVKTYEAVKLDWANVRIDPNTAIGHERPLSREDVQDFALGSPPAQTAVAELPRDDREAARLYKLAADQGDAIGQANLGVFYEQGRGGLSKDDREAARLYKLAADQGNATAQVNLAGLYVNAGGGLTQDDREAVRLTNLAADQGSAIAQAYLGFFYEQGRGGLPKDDGEAGRLYKLAADQGYAYGQVYLAGLYVNGRGGFPKDDREAVRLYRLAADQGIAGAEANLGLFYEQGRGGLPKDDREAARLYKLAADQGYAYSQFSLGLFYDQGRGGLPKDDREAARLYRLAADQGSAPAQVNLGFFYEQGRGGLPSDDREAARLYKLAADQGNVTAQVRLGSYYEQGRGGLPRDDGEAVRLYKLAADQGYDYGQINLARLHLNGSGGLPKDDREAARLYKLAADQGNAPAQANLGTLYREGRGGLPKDDREAARLYRLAADQGIAGAEADLGFFYEQGRGGLRKDDREAARLYKLAADQGNVTAQVSLGAFYELGRGGLRKDDREAARLYKLAADQGFAYGQAYLALLHANGRGGLMRDDRQAARLYKLAVDQGNAYAQVNLGFFYEQGRGGLPRDDGEAGRLYKLAADQGYDYGQINLARLYLNGSGDLPKDDREAARLYKLAADQGNAPAQANLGTLYRDGRGGLQKDDREAARLYRAAAGQGSNWAGGTRIFL
jgi:TPR repeat protein